MSPAPLAAASTAAEVLVPGTPVSTRPTETLNLAVKPAAKRAYRLQLAAVICALAVLALNEHWWPGSLAAFRIQPSPVSQLQPVLDSTTRIGDHRRALSTADVLPISLQPALLTPDLADILESSNATASLAFNLTLPATAVASSPSSARCRRYREALTSGLAALASNATVQEDCQAWCSTFAKDEAAYQHCSTACLQHDGQVAHHLEWMESSRAAAQLAQPASYEDVIFAIYYVQGGRGSEKAEWATHQLAKPDMIFAKVLRKSHPGARIVVITDPHTQLDTAGQPVEVWRYGGIDMAKVGRNAWANYYQYKAQAEFLRGLAAQYNASAAAPPHVVFMDMDVLALAPLGELFCGAFDYAFTVSDAPDMPVNIGTQFVRGGRYTRAAAFLDDMLKVYNLSGPFTAGQIAIAEYAGILDDQAAVYALQNEAVRDNGACRALGGGAFDVCFLPCTRYNYCHTDQSCCTDAARLPFALTSASDLRRAGVALYHFVGHRKAALDLVGNAFLRGGTQAAYEALASLPHSEADYQARGMVLNAH